jgi:hypothetical protein
VSEQDPSVFFVRILYRASHTRPNSPNPLSRLLLHARPMLCGAAAECTIMPPTHPPTHISSPRPPSSSSSPPCYLHSDPRASFDAAVTCFDSTAHVWAHAGHAFGAVELNALLHAFCACFDSTAHVWARAGHPFGAAEFNSLLRALCACYDSTAHVWARAGHAFVATELNALLHTLCACGRRDKAQPLFHYYCDT